MTSALPRLLKMRACGWLSVGRLKTIETVADCPEPRGEGSSGEVPQYGGYAGV